MTIAVDLGRKATKQTKKKNNLDILPPKPKFTFRHLKKVIQEFHRRFVLAPADKAANNVVVV